MEAGVHEAFRAITRPRATCTARAGCSGLQRAATSFLLKVKDSQLEVRDLSLCGVRSITFHGSATG